MNLRAAGAVLAHIEDEISLPEDFFSFPEGADAYLLFGTDCAVTTVVSWASIDTRRSVCRAVTTVDRLSQLVSSLLLAIANTCSAEYARLPMHVRSWISA